MKDKVRKKIEKRRQQRTKIMMVMRESYKLQQEPFNNCMEGEAKEDEKWNSSDKVGTSVRQEEHEKTSP